MKEKNIEKKEEGKKEKKGRREKRKKEIEKKGIIDISPFLSNLHCREKPFCQTFSKNDSNTTREAAPPEEPEPEPFWVEPEPCQTGP
jgi:hypothetical protein